MYKLFSMILAFLLVFMITLPGSGTFAEENKAQQNINSQKAEKDQNGKQAEKSPQDPEKDKAQPAVKAFTNKNEAEPSKESNSSTNEDSGDAEQADEETNQQFSNEPKEDENPGNEDNNPVEDEGNENAPSTEEGENDSTPAPPASKDANKSTQIHLHIDKCMAPVESGFVLVNSEWHEMTNPGSSPLFKMFDDGEFVKDDIAAFKLVFTSGEELVIPVDEVREGVEAEGSVNYWLENCELPAADPEEPAQTLSAFSTINVMVNENHEKIDNMTLIMMNGKRLGFERANNVFSLSLPEDIELDAIRGIEITSNSVIKFIQLTQFQESTIEIAGGVLTLEMKWTLQNETIEAEDDEDVSTAVPVNHSDSGGTSNQQDWASGELPQTGESSRMMFYVLGFLIAAGGVLLRFKNPLKN